LERVHRPDGQRLNRHARGKTSPREYPRAEPDFAERDQPQNEPRAIVADDPSDDRAVARDRSERLEDEPEDEPHRRDAQPEPREGGAKIERGGGAHLGPASNCPTSAAP